jgi:putative membrane protein
MSLLILWLVSALAVVIAAYLLPGVTVSSFGSALVVAVVLGLVNAVVKPVLVFLTLPVSILTLGLFTLVIDALLILLVSALVPGFKVAGFWWAVAFSVVLTIVGAVLSVLL